MSENSAKVSKGGLGRRGVLLGTTTAAAATVLAAAAEAQSTTPARPVTAAGREAEHHPDRVR
jgi:hypothetical protein